MTSVRTVEAGDLDAIERLMERRLRHSGAAWRQRLAWQWGASGWHSAGPRGAVLVDAGQIVGHHFGICQPAWVEGDVRLVTFALDLFVDERFRSSLASINLVRAVAPPGPEGIVATSSANYVSTAIWTRLRARAAVDGDIALVLPLRHGRLLLTSAERKLRGPPPTVPPQPWWPGPKHSLDIDLQFGWRGKRIGEPFEAAGGLWRAVRHQFPLTTDRDVSYLQWRYGPSSPGGALIGLSDARGTLRAWYAFRLSDRGGAVPLRVFKLLDIIASPDDAEAIAACAADARRRARRLADVIEARGMRAEFRAGLRAAGFHPRRLVSNPFLVWTKAKRAQALPSPDTWHLVSADGDAGFA